MPRDNAAENAPALGRGTPTTHGDTANETQGLLQDSRSSSEHAYPEHVHESTPVLFVWALTATAALSGLLFGYDTGVISSALVSIRSSLGHPLTTLDKSLITSITSFAALLASPLAGLCADAFGRKPVILLSDVLFIAGALLQAFAPSVSTLIAGRAIVGLGIGAASALTPLYIAETAPAHWRGRLITVSTLLITSGQVVAYVIGWALADMGSGWRWMVGLGALPAVLQVVGLIRMPETPRWLVKADRPEQALEVLKRIYGGDEDMARELVKGMEREIEEEGGKDGVGWMRKLRMVLRDLWTVPVNRKALTVACMLQGSQQLCGFNSLMYFSATIFAMTGFKSPSGTAILIAGCNFIFTLIAFSAIDRIGRRRILLISIPWMSTGLLVSAFAFTQVKLLPNSVQAHQNSDAAAPPWASALLVSSLLVFVAAYALGLGNVPWQQSELFGLRVRAIGSALATATNWACNALVGITFLPMMELISPAGAMAVYASVCGVVWVACWLIYPERMGVGLEDVGQSDHADYR
ncbi:putative MFS myo-inositol transporter [Microthyrium microscopicum]|uniref:Putative MFS myo-inositol transporter n=1 Tax=Microthyrium microscopicum TaxID=703497 RepID=A0A6A6UMS9_9PEZI|nr:putative MFS myo-inositol transporter [Microthyrium microscopicum]